MAKEKAIMRGSAGLNTVDDPVRIQYNPETGITDLAVAVNISISPTGRVNRRGGKVTKVPLGAHSMFCDGGECVFVHNAALYLLESNFSYRLLRELTGNQRVAYAQVDDKIYFTNDHDKGYVESGAACSWEKTTDYVGPVIQKIFAGPPTGNHLGYHGGRIYVSAGPVLWYSEYLAHSWFDMARSFIQFPSYIRMIKPVEGGIYVSTEKKIYFLKGIVPKTFTQLRMVDYPALEWSDAIGYINGTDISEYELAGQCAVWTTTEGAMLGTPEGGVINLNKRKVVYPQGTEGCSLIRGLNFIHTVQ